MAEIKDGGPAFPPSRSNSDFHGMTLRDWFAGQAMLGMLSSDAEAPQSDNAPATLAFIAYALADAMLKARGQ